MIVLNPLRVDHNSLAEHTVTQSQFFLVHDASPACNTNIVCERLTLYSHPPGYVYTQRHVIIALNTFIQKARNLQSTT